MELTLYYNGECSKCRQALDFLEPLPVKLNVIYYMEGLDRQHLEDLISIVDDTILGQIVRGSDGSLTRLQIIELLAQDSTRLERPLLVDYLHKRVVIGRPVDKIRGFVDEWLQ
jgi:arsenate reductase-like glutaredoxin family protein